MKYIYLSTPKFVLIIICFLLVSCSKKIDYGNFSKGQICKATIAFAMWHEPEIINIDNVDNDIISVSYIRPSDKKLWRFKCKLEGKRIIYAYDPGRWRNGSSSSDTILTLSISDSGNVITILEDVGNAQTLSKTFTIKQLTDNN